MLSSRISALTLMRIFAELKLQEKWCLKPLLISLSCKLQEIVLAFGNIQAGSKSKG